MITCGIDPGLQGAIAFLGPGIDQLTMFDMPVKEMRGRKREVDWHTLAEIFLGRIHELGGVADMVFLEYVTPMTYVNPMTGQKRGQGAAASFQFGKGLGVILGVLAALRIPYRLQTPGVWKSRLGLGRDKKASLKLAREKFPGWARIYFERQKDDGRAEAALLALLARDFVNEIACLSEEECAAFEEDEVFG